MKEITTDTEFDYSLVDYETEMFLKEKEKNINRISSKSAYDIGKELKEAQDKMAKKGYGNFEVWYRSVGFKKTESYQYINHYNFVRSESERSRVEMFESAPKSIQTEISKPSANPHVNEAYFDGNITTHKEYKELEKQLKEKDRQLEQAKKSEQIAIEQLEHEQNKPPQVIEKEVIPDDYEDLKQRSLANQTLKEEISSLKRQLSQQDENSKKYEELNRQLKEMNGQLTEGQKRLQAQTDMYRFVEESNQAIDKLSTLIYLVDENEMSINEYAREPIEKIVDDLEDICGRLNQKLSQSKVIEGEIIDG